MLVSAFACDNQVVNLSTNTAVTPDCFKLAILNPLLKKMGLDFEVFANFRPISNLMFMSKLTEGAIALQVIDYITINNLDEVFQSAYKQLHSTETALLKVQNDILVALDNHQSVMHFTTFRFVRCVQHCRPCK